MSRLATTFCTVALLASIASVASAGNVYPPGPPYRSCPDSVTIYQIQRDSTDGNNCQPAWNDTVLGVRGIVCGFRLRSTGRIYLENSNAADYNGLQIYTVGHMETQGIAIGDSISVCGINGSYQNESQLLGTLGTTITVRKINSGNPLPPFRVGTTTAYKWTPASGAGSSFATANPVEGMLVRVNGPLKVARIGPGAGLSANTAWLMVNANGTAPGDSIMVDGYQLTSSNIIAPPLGYTVDWVQGIMRRAAPAGVDAWIISLRDPNDQLVQAPPNLSEAFPVADNKLRLIFDKNVDVTSAQNPANYALGSQLSGSTVDAATVVGGAGYVVELTLTDVLPRLSIETIQTQGIGAAACPACLSGQQSLTFILGVLSCLEVQTPLADSLQAEPCLDKSRFAGPSSALGERATVRGVFVKGYGGSDNLFYFEDAAGGPRSGVAAYNVPFGPVIGHQYLLACRVQEYYGMTELNNPVAMIDEGMVGVPAPQLQPVAVLSDQSCDPNEETLTAEDFEDVLVRVQNVKVVPFNSEPILPSPGGSFRVVGRPALTDTLLISSSGAYTFAPDTGMVLNINGCLYFSDDRGPRIWPRGDSDITLIGTLGVPSGTPAKVSFSATPNPARVTQVSFTLPARAEVDLSVFDLSGRKVATLASGSMSAGRYARDWDGGAAGAGVYFVRLRVGSESYNLRTINLK